MDEIDDEMDDYDDYEMDQGSEGDMEGKIMPLMLC